MRKNLLILFCFILSVCFLYGSKQQYTVDISELRTEIKQMVEEYTKKNGSANWDYWPEKEKQEVKEKIDVLFSKIK